MTNTENWDDGITQVAEKGEFETLREKRKDYFRTYCFDCEKQKLIYSNKHYEEEDVKEFIQEILKEIKNVQKDYLNSDWISKEQVMKIIKEKAGDLK